MRIRLIRIIIFFLVFSFCFFLLDRFDRGVPLLEDTHQMVEREQARVVRVVDGDTIEIDGGTRVRLIGIDTPERSPEECFGKAATVRLKEWIEGRVVLLERDVSDKDRYGRLLRYVYADNVLINEALVREGYAKAKQYPPDTSYHTRFQDAEYEAKQSNRGLWGVCEEK